MLFGICKIKRAEAMFCSHKTESFILLYTQSLRRSKSPESQFWLTVSFKKQICRLQSMRLPSVQY